MMRTPFIAANWKMNTDVSDALALVEKMLSSLDKITGIDKVICPPYISLFSLKEFIKKTSLKLGAQNMYFQEKGAFTGEISPLMLKNLVEFVILGHSERRQYFFETDDIINKKIKAAIEHKLTPIFCIGENQEEKTSGLTDKVLTRQLTDGLKDINPLKSMVIAYEPVWAIGTGNAATGREASNTIRTIRDIVGKLWNKETASDIRILYGGSVASGNIAEFMGESEIDGALIGGAGLKADEFISIVKQSADIKAV
jgi:triosephosphate isomerase (TIM)